MPSCGAVTISCRLTVAIAMAFDVTTGSLPPANDALLVMVRLRESSGAVPPPPPSMRSELCAESKPLPPSRTVRPLLGLGAGCAWPSPEDGSTLWL